ncbi:serine/threonine-protein kinase/endoribonuclease IRE1b-like, partial [Trifolium medium]|nr:serine/threonine-protein kinase/endoribonuclease IRE1b-like [Trifolium medium]
MTRCQLWERHDGSPSPTLLGIIKDVIDSFTCLQEHGVLHHNITLHNILIFSNGNGEELCAKLADFSLCSLLSDDPLPTNMAQRSNPRLTD